MAKETAPVNLPWPVPSLAESPHNDYNTAGMPNAPQSMGHLTTLSSKWGGESMNGILSGHQTQMYKLLMK